MTDAIAVNDVRPSICVALSPLPDSRFTNVLACDGETVLLRASRNPIQDIARGYLLRGEAAETPLTIRCGPGRPPLQTTIGEAARGTAFVGGNVVPFRRKQQSILGSGGDAA